MTARAPQYGEMADYGANDVCYRHPDRQSFTLCQRCGNTICQDCQTLAAVGLLCADCAATKTGGQAAGGVKRRLGRRLTVSGRRYLALETPVTYTLLALSCAVFIVQLLGRYIAADQVTQALWYLPIYSLPPGEQQVPAGVLSSYPLGGIFHASFEPWRMLTVMFAHSVSFWPHLIFNMLTLWIFGRNLENIIGSARFLLLYLLAGFGGSLGMLGWSYVQVDALFTPTVGASGAIFGLLSATLVAFRALRIDVRSLAVLIAINIGIGFMPGTNIAWQAHLGGLITGAFLMWIFIANRGPRFKKRQLMAVLATVLLLCALSASYFVFSPL